MSAATPPDKLEKIPGARYEIVERLGTGAFGSVYRAQDAFLNRLVAVKSIRLDTTLDGEHRKALNKRFIREAQIAAQLHHPHIVTIHDIIFTPDTGFIVMEFIEGRTLQSLLKEGKLTLEKALDITLQVASALAYAHEHKIIHRDVKPANIMVTPRFEARITDFGIAKSDGASHLTMSGTLVGTPDYMSPEQAKGEEVDLRSDIFSLGCVLFECAAGEKPFHGGSLTAVLLSIVNGDPFQSPAWKSCGAPASLEAVLKRSMAKDPRDRYASAEELATALQSVERDPEPRREAARPPLAPPADDLGARRRAAARLRKLKEEERPLRFADSASDQLQEMSLTPAQGFILSRIDGASLAREILALSPMPEPEVAETLADLLDRGLLDWGEIPQATETRSEQSTRRPRAKPAMLNQALQQEMERILTVDRKERPAPNRRAPVTKETKEAFDRSSYAEELFHRAQKAYETRNYWEAIQLLRQAVELDGSRAEFHHLLGLGLMKNRNWMKEASECLRRATELDPTKAEYFDLLATIYKAAGLPEESAAMLERAKALSGASPDPEIPNDSSTRAPVP